jgi:uncharacterized protein YjbJ (UPF0337 family)
MHNHINWDDVRSHWDEYRDKVKHQWTKLTDDDIRDIRGDRQRLMQALQDRYEITKDKVEKEVTEFFEGSGNWIDQAKQKVLNIAEQGKQYVRDNSLPDMTNDLQQVIRRHPIRSALVSLGIGYVLAKLGSMTSRS